MGSDSNEVVPLEGSPLNPLAVGGAVKGIAKLGEIKNRNVELSIDIRSWDNYIRVELANELKLDIVGEPQEVKLANQTSC